MRLPKTLGGAIDLVFRTEQQIKEAELEIEKLPLAKLLKRHKLRKDTLLEHIKDSFDEKELQGASGRFGEIELARREGYKIDNWATLQSFIVKNDAFDIYQRRVVPTAIGVRMADGVKVPGVSRTVTISIKVRAKNGNT